MHRGRALEQELGVSPGVLLQLAATRPETYPVFFESAVHGPLGVFSILAAQPRAALWVDRFGRLGATGLGLTTQSFLGALEAWWQAEGGSLETGRWPFVGGWVVFLGYEMASEIEPRLVQPPGGFPWRAFALRTPAALVHELSTGRVTAVAEPGAEQTFRRLLVDVSAVAGAPCAGNVTLPPATIEEEPAELFLERVRRALRHIEAGDIYQANLSRRWRTRLGPDTSRLPGGHTAALYGRLRRTNPAPFAALAQWGGAAILSSSPERLLKLESGEISTRPIAGTRARSRRSASDSEEAALLIGNPKERAEHVMLVDLERNDLGRVCVAGSVQVEEFMRVESYEHVHHIVSGVRGRLRPGTSPIDALRAVFPGGTITGCPKFRCMQIIGELEGEGRGPYTGSLGYLGLDGRADFNILIRTMSVVGAEVEWRAGAGIVAESQPERELEETREKARGLLRALGDET
ncbi:MAG: aminodeoxychorismate synthase component I [Gammaproteobacteria bacterium]|nr:aminodeoxychorismate synthase component I [Gammaproteobacteria bacterium]